MNKIVSFLFLCSATLTFAQNQQLARRYALCEHFTQASCGPCAQKNPAFQEFYDANGDKVHHIAYHTDWPGTDPMNAANPTDVETRVDYYGVSGVPTLWVNGTIDASPDQVDGALVGSLTEMGSPIKLYVSETVVGTQHTANIRVRSLANVPAGNYKLYAAVVERNVNYTNAPGSNGEKYFPNVFRKMLPNDAGDTFTAANAGQEVSFSYDYTAAANWNANELYVVAFVQEVDTKEVMNSGSSRDLQIDYVANNTPYVQNTTAEQTVFAGSLVSNYTDPQIVNIDVQTDAPADWQGNLNIFGADLPLASTSFEFAGGSANDFAIKVTPGATFALATYRLTFSSTNPNEPPVTYTYFVNNGVTDLVLGNGTAYQSLYETALRTAGATRLGSITRSDFAKAYQAGALASVRNIYYNVGWIFPALTDETTAILTEFIDGGGDLLIAGQDIGWDIATAPANGGHSTPATSNFYSNYLHASYVADGDGTNSQLKAVTSDAIFGGINNSSVIDVYNGNMYPDQINPTGTATATFTYNTAAKTAGIRYNNDTHKLVYLGIGLEMVGTEAVRNNIFAATYQWFHSDEIYSATTAVLNNTAFVCLPNPASTYLQVQAPTNGNGATTFVLTDLSGKTIAQYAMNNATTTSIDVQQLPQGTYMGYFVQQAQRVSAAQKITIVR